MQTTEKIQPQIDREQFLQDMETLAQFGRQTNGAIHRVAYSAIDMEARQWLHQRLEAIGLTPEQDEVGNTVAIYPAQKEREDSQLAPIAIGSHTDTVPMGGAYDGALGVVAALAVLEALHTTNMRLYHPVALINFAAEEATMAGGTTGSQAMTGLFEMDTLEKNAWDGRIVREHLTEAELDPNMIQDAQRGKNSFAAFIELHVEQSDRLEQAGLPIAIVDGFVGIRRYAMQFNGTANHAGTTPMAVREDALVMAAPMIHFVQDLAVELGIVGTIGDFKVYPGATNVIPERVELTVEIRGLDSAILDQAEEIIEAEAAKLGGRCSTVSHKPPVQTASKIQQAIASTCTKLGLEYLTMPSGAGHDAMNMDQICPIGMFFVPSKAGISHAKEEYTSPEDCLNGAEVLLETVLQLDRNHSGPCSVGTPHASSD